MIVEKQGFSVKGGKTERAVEVATEELLNERFVLYITHELVPEEICKRIEKVSEDVTLLNLLICTVNPEQVRDVLELQEKDTVVIIDVGVDISEEIRDFENDIYIYYQV